MARPLRIEVPNGLYHVTRRGLKRLRIVRDDVDRARWTALLDQVATRRQWRVYAWALTNTHFEVFLRVPNGDLSAGMHELNAAYVNGFNGRHGRAGALFYDRFKSVLVEPGVYEWELSRVVHLSPVRAGLVIEPAAYRWSSCGGYFNSRLAPHWLAWEEILEQQGQPLRAARRQYRAFLREGMWSRLRSPLKRVVASTFLGSPGFVERMKERLARRDVPAARKRRPSVSAAKIERAVCDAYLVARKLLRTRRKHYNEPRQVAIYLTRKLTTLRLAAIGERFGHVCPSLVANVTRKVSERIGAEPRFAARVRRIENSIIG